MEKNNNKGGFDRRLFIKSAGAMALFGTLGSTKAIAGGMGQASSMSMSYDLDVEYNRVGFNNAKWDMIIAQNSPAEVKWPMGVADMDFITIPQVTSALKKRLEHKNWGYELPPKDYTDNIVAWNKKRYNQDVPKANILNCLGVLDGVLSILKTFNKDNAKVLIHTPGYSGFFSVIHQAGYGEIENPLKLVNGRYQMDYDLMEEQLGDDIKILLFCNPQNPVGNCWTADEMRKMGDICNRKGVLVIADEIHCDFVNKHAKYVPYSTIGKEYAMNSFTLKSTSKSFNLAAHRTGYMFSDNDDYIKRVIDGGHHRELLNIMGLIAGNAAYKHGAKYMDDMQAYIDGNSKFLEKTLKEKIPLIKYNVHEGTYLAWLDCSALAEKLDAAKMAEEETAYNMENNVMRTGFFGDKSIKTMEVGDILNRWFIEKAGVNVNQGEHYGKNGVGYMRMNLGTTRKKLTDALASIEKAINKI